MLAQEVGWPVSVTDPLESASTSVLLPLSLEPIEQDQVWFGSKGKLYCLIKERRVVLFLLYSKVTQLHTYVQSCSYSFPFPPPVDHILSELSTMTHLSWVALQGMAHSFIEGDKAVVHVIRLVSFL